LFFTSSLNLLAAPDSGRISGKILDPQGVAIAGAHLRLNDSAGSLVRETTSDTQGYFIVKGIQSAKVANFDLG
jgi:L-lactate permease